MTKTPDQLLFQFYAKNDGLQDHRPAPGHRLGHPDRGDRGVDERLINRFDYDGDYGTVLNRFLMQAAVGYPLTVHGTGGQTRAFIHIQDTVRCIELALENPPKRGDRVKILNQMTETPPGPRPGRAGRRDHRRRVDHRRQPAQRGRRERPVRREPPASRSRPRADHARGRLACRGRRRRPPLRLPGRPQPGAGGLGLDQGHRRNHRARPRGPAAEERLLTKPARGRWPRAAAGA